MKNLSHIKKTIFILAIFSQILIFNQCSEKVIVPEWPEITQENKPWTRWWWLGNILNEEDLSYALQQYDSVGFGGVEITPIYGVKGYEDKFIKYLSSEWVEKLLFTLEEAEKRNLGVDMATGTGWPFGGPWVGEEDASKYMVHQSFSIGGGTTLNSSLLYIAKPFVRSTGRRLNVLDIKDPVTDNDSLQQLAIDQIRFEKPLKLLMLVAYDEKGNKLDLTDKATKGNLDWVAPEGEWILYAIYEGQHGKMVERAAPGGEGLVIDHFNKTALLNYFKKFDEALENKDISSLRAFFNDSYEVDDARGQADFTPDLFIEFQNRRGYDLSAFFPALFGDDTINGMDVKVLMDYRLTISELLLEKFTTPWYNWANEKNTIIRNQAHGSPSNILDLYAQVDIPETEGKDLLKIKFATSASNITGKKLTSSESATWLNDHFLSTLDDTRKNINRYFLGGVNHIFYHGTPLSPKEEKWPGFLFYASVHYGPTNPFWDDFKSFNDYVANCQSLLQSSVPDNDVLLYFPFYDRIAIKGNEMLQHFSGGGPRGSKVETTFRKTARKLIDAGYSVDFISDKQIESLYCKKGKILSNGGAYQTLVIPECKYMTLETLKSIQVLVHKGAKVIFCDKLPTEVPGYDVQNIKTKEFQLLKNHLKLEKTGKSYSLNKHGKGALYLGEDLLYLLDEIEVRKEEIQENGLSFLRKKNEFGSLYFIVNNDSTQFNSWLKLKTKSNSVVAFNPQTKNIGKVSYRKSDNNTEAYIQLKPGESIFLQTNKSKVECEPFMYLKPIDEKISIDGNWRLEFIKGGPDLPKSKELNQLLSWTSLDDESKAFSGTAKYTISFNKPQKETDLWSLDLGEVHESARIILNDEELGVLYSPPYSIVIPSGKLKESNKLEVLVSNLMANRIIDMEQKGEEYKRFYNINFAARLSENRGIDGLFTTQNWEPLTSGLLGPVVLNGMEYIEIK